jgi:hypothetical protein
MILIPCRVTRRARSITLRLIGYQPTLDRTFSAWANHRTNRIYLTRAQASAAHTVAGREPKRAAGRRVSGSANVAKLNVMSSSSRWSTK